MRALDDLGPLIQSESYLESAGGFLDDLNLIYAELIEAANRYLHLAVTTKGLDQLAIRDLLHTCQQRAIEHAQKIASKIIQLGGVPSVDLHLRLPGEKCTGNEAIHTALAYEQGALDLYRDLLEKAAGDLIVEEFARTQIGAQSEHVSRLYMLLEK